MMPEVLDDKSKHVIPFLLDQLKIHQEKYKSCDFITPFFLGLNGVQGAGKTTLVSAISDTLALPPYSLPVAVISIDDYYLPHSSLRALAAANPSNALVQHRGEPSTHDLPLLLSTFRALRAGERVKLPRFDKSLFDGQGDRVPEEQWEEVNAKGAEKIKVVIFEGWCVGFKPLSEDTIREEYARAILNVTGDYHGRLAHNKIDDILFVNNALRDYEELTAMLDALVHLDAEDTQYVYQWRLDQEVVLRAAKGMGMTDEQVKTFIDGYYPAYELYTEPLREGVFRHVHGRHNEIKRQMRLILGRMREVKEVILV